MELYHHPANLFVAGFLGAPSMNFISVDARAVDDGRATVANAALDPIEVSTAGRDIRAGRQGDPRRPSAIPDPERGPVRGHAARQGAS